MSSMWYEAERYAEYMGEGRYDEPDPPLPGEEPLDEDFDCGTTGCFHKTKEEAIACWRRTTGDVPEEDCPF